MNLEDHVGDIIRKARVAAGVSSEVAAAAANLSAAELARLEESGLCSNNPDLAKLAPMIGLNAAKLERIASGWLPAGIDCSGWRELRQVVTARRFQVNSYLVWDEVTREGAWRPDR